MKNLTITRTGFSRFVDAICRDNNVIGPVGRKFEEVSCFKDVDLKVVNTKYSAKDIILPQKEDMYTFSGNKMKEVIGKDKKIIFGMRACDINAIARLDALFLEKPADMHYKVRRENTMIIGVECDRAGDNCFCESLGTNEVDSGFDLLFRTIGRAYLCKVGSKKGERLLRKYKQLFKETRIVFEHTTPGCKKRLTKKGIDKLAVNFDNKKVWDDVAERCLSCSACTITCPSCGCFEVHDEVEFDISKGVRYRSWSSCQQKDFTKVAGGFVFRDERSSRLKHRIYHKLKFYKERFGEEHMCIGCGRCITNCVSGIDMVDIINNKLK